MSIKFIYVYYLHVCLLFTFRHWVQFDVVIGSSGSHHIGQILIVSEIYYRNHYKFEDSVEGLQICTTIQQVRAYVHQKHVNLRKPISCSSFCTLFSVIMYKLKLT